MKFKTKWYFAMVLTASVLFTGCSRSSQSDQTKEQVENTTEAVKETSIPKIVDNEYLGLRYFTDLAEAKKLVCENDAVTINTFENDSILISGANEALKETRILLDEEYDFGNEKIQRIMVNGLGQKGYITKVNVFLDEAEEPTASIKLNPQDDEGEWLQIIKNTNEIVLDKNITGKHKVEFSVCQYTENGEIRTDGDAEALLASIQFVAETIPLINIRIDESLGTIAEMNNDETHSTKCSGEFDIMAAEDYTGDYSDANPSGTFEMKYIKGRGNSTWTAGLRLPYKIKLSEPADLFGMGSNTNWALIANALDNDLIRNAFTYKIGEELGLSYTPQCVSVDVMMNGEYLGNYILCENIRVESGRIEIDDLDLENDPENITGGYLIGAGAWGADEDAYVFTTSHGAEFNVNSPCDSENPGYEAEIEYIVNYMQRIENAIYEEPDPETGVVEDPFDLMDLDAAVKYYWIQELSANSDFFITGSTYCYKERDGKLFWGPIWDFDIAWRASDIGEDCWKNQISWFQIMLTNETFSKAAEDFYKETLKPLLDKMLSEDGYCNQYYEKIKYSALNNLAIWGFNQDGTNYERNYSKVKALFEESHQSFMDNVKHRVQWCYDNLDSLKTEKVKIIFMSEGEIVDSRYGYANTVLTPFPENPEVPNKRFIEWNYDGVDYDGNPAAMVFNEYVTVPAAPLKRIDGEMTFTVYASYEDRDESREVKEIRFQQSSYNLYLNPESEENTFDVPLQITPADGYVDEIKWSSSDESVIKCDCSGNFLSMSPGKAGTAIITGTLMDGTECSFPVTVTALEENDSPENYVVTDFKLSEDTLTLHVGETAMIGIEVLSPKNYLNLLNEDGIEYAWQVESGDACSIGIGCIVAETAGTSVVVCRNAVSSQEHTCTITVVE